MAGLNIVAVGGLLRASNTLNAPCTSLSRPVINLAGARQARRLNTRAGDSPTLKLVRAYNGPGHGLSGAIAMGLAEEKEAERLRVAVDTLRFARVHRIDLDDLVEEASSGYKAEIALVSIVVTNQQRFVSVKGLSAQHTHREVSFCDHAIRREGPFSVPDATNDVRFMFNPLVLSQPNIRSYLGAPIFSEGQPIGALCVISPRVAAFELINSNELMRLSNEVSRRLAERA